MFKWLTNWLESRRLRKQLQLVANIQLREGSMLVFEFPHILSGKSAEILRENIEIQMKAKAMILQDGLKLAGVVHQPTLHIEPLSDEGKNKIREAWRKAYTGPNPTGMTPELIAEYGELAPEVAAAKAKSTRGYQPRSNTPIPAMPKPPCGP